MSFRNWKIFFVCISNVSKQLSNFNRYVLYTDIKDKSLISHELNLNILCYLWRAVYVECIINMSIHQVEDILFIWAANCQWVGIAEYCQKVDNCYIVDFLSLCGFIYPQKNFKFILCSWSVAACLYCNCVIFAAITLKSFLPYWIQIAFHIQIQLHCLSIVAIRVEEHLNCKHFLFAYTGCREVLSVYIKS